MRNENIGVFVNSNDNKAQFEQLLRESFDKGSFVKATLSKSEPGYRWGRVAVSAFLNARDVREVSFEYSDGRQVERKNVPLAQAHEVIATLLADYFRSAYVKTEEEDISFEKTDKGSFRLKRKQLVATGMSLPHHNRKKNYLVDANSPFLIELGISSKEGVVRRERYDKFRQIQKFVEIIASLIPDHELSATQGLSTIDFGSGKHYLTFALHHFLLSHSPQHRTVGIEQREELVTTGKQVAACLHLSSIDFMASSIEAAPMQAADLVVALHACDTATDDAIAQAVAMKARYICVAPCCHKYVRQRLSPSPDLKPILKHGILAERFADSLTDSLRVLTLESLGYQAKLFEFISSDHTAKNTMITAVFTGRKNTESARQIAELRQKFQLSDFYLDRKIQTAVM
jgi:hypothetical protein